MPWLAVPALAVLFATWMRSSPRTAALIGYAAGVIFFALDFTWFGETAGALLGPFGFILDIGPALLEGLAFALAAAVTSFAARSLHGAWIAVASAAAFALAEWLRSSGDLGVPLYQIGAAFIETPLAAIAADGGVYALTFTIALAGALLGQALAERTRAAVRSAVVGIALLGIADGGAWWAWPARTVAPGTLRVAAIQADIKQSLKWAPETLEPAIATHIALTDGIAAFRPAIVLWPETVVTTHLLLGPELATVPGNADEVRNAAALRTRLAALAQRLDTQLIVGSLEAAGDSDRPTGTVEYNDLFTFGPGRRTMLVYRKRRLVPFAEYLPGPSWLRRLPGASLASDFGVGTDPAVIAPYGTAPLICWESDFGEAALDQVRRGARILAVATDDAWFGSTDGPYAHAQVSQVRAVETGRWTLRAATTGISGIIGPDGRWRERTPLGVVTAVTGTVGDPVSTPYSAIGPGWVAGGLAFLAVLAFGLGRRRP